MKKRVGIIEDNPDQLEILKTLLEKEGYEVFAAPSGFDIAERMVKENPDLILLDLVLPGLAGEKVIDAFRASGLIIDTPIIIISAKEEEEIKNTAKKIDAAGWMRKPIDNKRLLQIIGEKIR